MLPRRPFSLDFMLSWFFIAVHTIVFVKVGPFLYKTDSHGRESDLAIKTFINSAMLIAKK